jgi:hypothetical protein
MYPQHLSGILLTGSSEAVVHPSEDARVVAADEEDLAGLKFLVAALGYGKHFHGVILKWRRLQFDA